MNNYFTIRHSLIFIFVAILVLHKAVKAQEIDITSALRQIESGRIELAEKNLQELKTKNPDDPSVLFLDAVLTKDGNSAVNKYSIIVDKYPKSKYADAALYRIFSYYYSIGLYKKAEENLARLKKDYPNSPYLKTADKSLPAEDRIETKSESKKELATTDSLSDSRKKNVDSSSFNFTIQAGAFLNIDNAKNLCSTLNNENYSTEITTKEIGGSTLNIVSVGKFEKAEDAAPLLKYLEKNFGLKGRVIKITN